MRERFEGRQRSAPVRRRVYANCAVPEITPTLYRAGSGEPLLLLHGFTGAWMHWRPLLEGLSQRYEVIAPTLAGHDGARAYPLSSPMNLAGSTDALEGDLDELGVGSAHIAGNSMGGALALELAKRGRARSVVALAPGGGWTPGDGEARRLARFFARQIRVTRALRSRMPAIVARRQRGPAVVAVQRGRDDLEARHQLGQHGQPAAPRGGEAVDEDERLALAGAVQGRGDLGHRRGIVRVQWTRRTRPRARRPWALRPPGRDPRTGRR